MGAVARAGFVIAPTGPNNEGFPSSAPANGPSTERVEKASAATYDNNHVHVNPYPNVAGPGSAAGLRSRQRELHPRPGGDRQRARQRRLQEPRTDDRAARTSSAKRTPSSRRSRRSAWRPKKGRRNERRRWWRRRDEVPVIDLQRAKPVRIGDHRDRDRGRWSPTSASPSTMPFKHGYRLNAVFANALNIHPKSPVRIAGVDVGKVSSIKRAGQGRAS